MYVLLSRHHRSKLHPPPAPGLPVRINNQNALKVVEFLRILEEYRLKCEEGGDYLEAGRALRQLDVLRRQETRRQQRAVRARQLYERRDVQVGYAQEHYTAWPFCVIRF